MQLIVLATLVYFRTYILLASYHAKNNKKTENIFTCFRFFLSDLDGIRTHDPRLRRALLYPAELPDHF